MKLMKGRFASGTTAWDRRGQRAAARVPSPPARIALHVADPITDYRSARPGDCDGVRCRASRRAVDHVERPPIHGGDSRARDAV